MAETRVQLTPSEILQCAIWGSMRNIESGRMAADKHGASSDRDGWQLNIMAVMAEAAWAKHRNIYYNASMNDYRAKDVGNYYQIRSSSIVYKSNACLRLHESDDDDLPYILALVGMRDVVFVGWMYGFCGKQPQFWRDRWGVGRPAFFIEQSDLLPMDTVPDIAKEE